MFRGLFRGRGYVGRYRARNAGRGVRGHSAAHSGKNGLLSVSEIRANLTAERMGQIRSASPRGKAKRDILAFNKGRARTLSSYVRDWF